MPEIGVFWFYKDTVLGKAVALDMAEGIGIGVLDSPDTHTDLWDNNSSLLRVFPELYGSEYFSMPRGRVLWVQKTSTARIFMDDLLFKETTKKKILKYFDLCTTNVQWEKDPHYTTDTNDIDFLFDD